MCARPEIVEENGRFIIALGDLRIGCSETRCGAEMELGVLLEFHEAMQRADVAEDRVGCLC